MTAHHWVGFDVSRNAFLLYKGIYISIKALKKEETQPHISPHTPTQCLCWNPEKKKERKDRFHNKFRVFIFVLTLNFTQI